VQKVDITKKWNLARFNGALTWIRKHDLKKKLGSIVWDSCPFLYRFLPSQYSCFSLKP